MILQVCILASCQMFMAFVMVGILYVLETCLIQKNIWRKLIIQSVSNEVSLMELLCSGILGSLCCEGMRGFMDSPGTSVHMARA